MTSWRWVRDDVIFAGHDSLLAQHGGLQGVRNREAILAALARPQQLAVYGEPAPDASALAAAYAYRLTRSHGFSDGNKRIGLFAALVFLSLNGIHPKGFNKPDTVVMMNAVAAGSVTESELAQWFRARLAG